MSKLNLDQAEAQRRRLETQEIKSLLDKGTKRPDLQREVRQKRIANWSKVFKSVNSFPSHPVIQWEEVLETKRILTIDRTKAVASGHLSEVYGARLLDGKSATTAGGALAVKILRKSDFMSAFSIANPDRQWKLLLQLNHPCIVRLLMLYEVVKTNKMILLMQRAKMGNLDQVVQQYGHVSEDLSKKWTRDLLWALDYLHNLGIGHRRVHPRHVLIQSPDSPAKLSIPDAFVEICDPVKRTPVDATGIGFVDEFVAPEAVFGSLFDVFALDIWGLGCTTFFMLTTRPPFSDVQNRVSMKQQLDKRSWTQVGIVDSNPKLSEEAKDFIGSCLRGTISKRAHVPELLLSTWIASLSL